MKEYIEKIIEIILEDVSCEHPEIEEYPRGAKSNNPTYSLDNENAVIKKCIEAIPARLIERPEITEEFLKKKTREILELIGKIHGEYLNAHIGAAKEFIQLILKEES